ncbi:TIGR00341 family protein [Haloarcula sp. S1CR25-12]|uniref:TIGR00341 family protein n=1 Tax=Haloarcula saliterrae TaxID=2950534 RepID=A0ABU2FDQ2_9EURY|nr:TIGR00341 family protein [Haloarcula sp. S1CR25-12]MDS0259960.1 TIGR00341 family protein [Haloarcula sp. S1CR25-12]
MRVVEISVPVGERAAVVDTLEAADIDYYLTSETSGRGGVEDYAAIVTFPLPRNAVEPVIDDLRDAGLSDDAHVIISDVEVDLSRRFQQLLDRYSAEMSWQIRISRAELRIRARELSPGNKTFLVLTVTSSLVATAGLLLDSAAVVVGAMVIAPLMGPALSASVGTALDDPAMFRRGVGLQVVGVSLAVVTAGAFASLLRLIPLFPPGQDITRIAEIGGRLAPDFLSLVIALGAGVAGIFSLSSGASAVLVGVMIAAALIPPAAAAGIAVAWGEPFAAFSAGVLVLVNVLAINLSALVTLRYLGYQPRDSAKREHSRSTTLKRAAVLLVLISVLSVFLGGITFASVQDAQFERSVRTATDETLTRPAYDGLELVEFTVDYAGPSLALPRAVLSEVVPVHRPRRVVVTVATPSDRPYPQLADRVQRRVRAETGHDVTVEVRYIETDTARPSSQAPLPPNAAR